MPVVLLLPLVVIGAVLLWAVLLPVILVQRYRMGRQRRRVTPWLVRMNASAMTFSAVSFLVGAAISDRWIPGSLAWSAGALGLGMTLGALGFALSRIEFLPDGLWLTPNRWLIGLLTALVAARIALGLWQLARHLGGGAPLSGAWQQVQSPATLLAVGGLLLGYYLTQTWLLRRRLPPSRRRR